MIYFFQVIVILLFTQNSHATTQKNEESPLLVQIVHRHGDRTPTKPWGPNDPNTESDWPQGWGQLTTEGMSQLFYLGQTLKKRYQGFLSDDFVNSEVYVRSSGVERALMSAQCNLAGLFPPRKERQWEPSLPWQPVPIHTSPVYDDWVMRSSKVCSSKYKELVDSYLNSSQRVTDFINNHLQLIVNVTKEAGLYKKDDNLENLRNAWRLGGNLHIARRYNKKLLPWMTDSVIEALYNLRAQKHGIQSQATPEIKRLQGGPFLGEILRNFLQFANGTLQPEDHTSTAGSVLKLLLFSGHDTNLAALLGVLGLYDPPKMLPYGTALIFELHKEEGTNSASVEQRLKGNSSMKYDPKNLIVKTFLMEGIDKKSAVLRRQMIPGCGSEEQPDCHLSKLTEMFRDIAVWSRGELMQICNGVQRIGRPEFYMVVIVIFLLRLSY